MVLVGLLEHSRESSDDYRFTVKGGVALELRLKDRARATKDIDLVLHHAEVDLARALERAVDESARGYQGFNFRRKGEPLVLENRTISVEFAVTYEGGTWTSIIVDVARAEPGEGETELLPAVPLQEATGITGPTELACVSLRMHIAQKLHGMTLPPRRGKRNERFKDLVDVLLMEPRVQRNREVLITDGPYLETKEHIGGFWVLEAADLDEALEWGRKAAVACRAPVEVRPFH
jgi:hypothetical protein